MKLRLAILAALVALAGCQQSQPEAPAADAAAAATVAASEREPDEIEDVLFADVQPPHVRVAEHWITVESPEDNVDSPASWIGSNGQHWVIATAKEGGGLRVYDGDTGEFLQRIGSEGDAPGQFRRPNGIFVHGDLLLAVERDNRRVQMLSLPDLQPLLSFGQGELQKPYGMWMRELADGALEVMVSDAYMAGEDAQGEEIPPPLAELDRRFQRYTLRREGESWTATHVGSFGDSSEAGAIRIPESMWGDEQNNRLLIAEEDQRLGTGLRVYSVDGRFAGQNLGMAMFKAQAEGIALWQCADGSGYWLATDQFKDRSLFHVFDRQSLQHLGAFAGERTANTDGVWLQQRATAAFPAGAFYAIHDDMAVAAFDWRDIAKALQLRET
ncbi:MAG TPA: hypothetical protein VFY12_11905, partial [Arenimonas sp.]|nr:hypothetical protein [Arenimonas sp.]